MRITTLACALSGLLLAGCLPGGGMQLPGSQSRFSIDSYTENTNLSSDLTGVWIAIHKGQLLKNMDGVDYDITGSIREVVEISKSGGVYYLRTCVTPEVKQAVSVSGNTISVTMNEELASLTSSSNTFMSGTAAHSVSGSKYSGTLSMKKVAPLNDTFGLFNYYNASLVQDVATASCFQEGALHVVGTKWGISKWSDLEIASVSDWTAGNTYQQVSYMMSRAGNADPAKQFQFKEGSLGMDAVVRQYPANGESISVSTSAALVNSYQSSFSVGSEMSGIIDLDFAIGTAEVVATGSGTSTTTTTTTTPTGSTGDATAWDWTKWWTW